MNKIIVDVYCGNYVVETAEVQLLHDKIVDIKLKGNDYLPLKASYVESSRAFWRDEYARMNMVMGESELISRSIGMNLYHVNEVVVDEDSWIDSAFEDRFAGVEYTE